jgi:hypothetical protein
MSDAPKKYTVRTVKTYWSCRELAHRHKSKEIAQRCLDEYARRDNPREKKWSEAAVADAKAMQKAGCTLRVIGQKYGVGPERIRQVLWRDHYRRARAAARAESEWRSRLLSLPAEELRETAREMAEATAADWNTDPALGACVARYYLEDLAPPA